jgi:hypothetical protein
MQHQVKEWQLIVLQNYFDNNKSGKQQLAQREELKVQQLN